ncbi:MAG: hypothetical protein ACJAZO_000726 [Myxococcota bacterium]|jgi:hypothetical protein
MFRTSFVALVALLIPATAAMADSPNDDGIAAVDFGEWAFETPEVVEPAMTLTASDGTGLRLRSISAKAVVQGPLAYTELHLTFNNPEQRTREGRFEITLPEGAAISRFAMNIEGQWQEGEVVEQQLARRAYEDFLHRRQDPALLESDGGNQFRARVFPIPAGADKELIIAYSQEITSADGLYRLPTAGLPMLDTFDIEVAIETVGRAKESIAFHRERTAPEGDVVVATGGPQAQLGVQHGDLAMARVLPNLRAEAVSIGSMTVLVDTSASRALGLAGDIEGVQSAIAELGRTANFPLRVIAFDQTREVIFDGRARDFGATHAQAIRDRGAFGASDLAGALGSIDGYERVLLVTDGVVTAGDDETLELSRDVRNAGNRGVRRLDVLGVGGIRDAEVLRTLATVLPQSGTVLDADTSASEVARRLQLDVVDLVVSVPGAEWVWPEVLEGVQPGDARTVFAKIDGQLDVHLAGSSVGPIPMAAVQGPLLEREWVQARMQRLLHMADATDDVDIAEAYRNQVTTLSVEHRVLTDSTSLLVLETEADYARFGIDRNGLADVLVIEDGSIAAVTRAGRTAPIIEWARPTQQPRLDDFTIGERDEEAFLHASSSAVSGGMDSSAVAASSEVLSDLDLRGAPSGLRQQVSANEQMAVSPAPTRRSMNHRPSPMAMQETDSLAMDSDSLDDSGMDQPSIVATADRTATPLVGASPGGSVLLAVQSAVSDGNLARALAQSRVFVAQHPGDVLGLLALGEALEANDELAKAARVYGSIIDLFPSRADMRRMAGERLDALGDVAHDLAVDTYEEAREQRPDHPSSHRQLAWAQVRGGEFEAAFDTLEAAIQRVYPGERFAGVDLVVRDDIGLVAAAWIADDPSVRGDVTIRLTAVGASLPTDSSVRFVITWETDANDVDLHVYDPQGNHAYYGDRVLRSGGSLFADVTTGFGPECFAINGKAHGPYRIQAHYYSQGPMGFGMGTLHVIRHDGQGKLTIEDQPFVVQADGAWIDLGTYAG